MVSNSLRSGRGSAGATDRTDRHAVEHFVVLALLSTALSCTQEAQHAAPGATTERVAAVAAPLNAAPRTRDFVVEAQNSIRLQTGARATGADLGARGTGSGPFLSGSGSGAVALDIASAATTQTSRSLIADSIRLGIASIVGDVQTNRFVDAIGALHGSVTALVALPALPPVTPVTPGTSNLTVAALATVSASPGKFATVSVGTAGRLRLAAGAYDLGSLSLALGARVEALGPVQLRIVGRLTASDSAVIGAASGVTLTAKDIRIEVSGINGTTGTLSATPKAAVVGNLAQIRALVLVPNGTLVLGTGLLGTGTFFTGAFFAKDVDVGAGVQVVFQDGFACSAAASCNDNNPCTTDACNSGTCANTPVATGTACADGNACNGNETCNAAGSCTAGTPLTCTALDQCHVAGTCSPATGCTNPNKANGSACNDANACTGSDSCVAGTCTGANPVTCGALDQCHVAGVCNPASGTCSNPNKPNGTACNDGSACTTADACQAGACASANPIVCTASDQCHTMGTCNPGTGACSNPAQPNGTACNDGNANTVVDLCTSGTCAGVDPCAGVTCEAIDQCHVAGTCDPTTGACSFPERPDGTACNDGNACTRADSCVAGACLGADRVACTASDQCHTTGTCDPSTGTCSNPVRPSGTACNDANPVTVADACTAGTCAGVDRCLGVQCAASDVCHVAGTCNPATGQCSNPPGHDGATCSDGDACTRTDACFMGRCLGHDRVFCDAPVACHAEGICDPASGACTNSLVADGTPCSDGDGCTQTDVCQAGVCSGGNPVSCAASDSCHVAGTCAPTSGECSNPLKPECAVAVHITSPDSLITVGSFPIQVTGTVSQPDAVLTLNGVSVANVGGTFSGAVALDEGHNTIVVRAVKGGQQATDSVFLSLDMTPPYVTVESHTHGQTVYANTVTITGLINDIVRGTLEQNQALVTVNGVAATISNRSYAARNVPLTPGDNVITVIGTDQVGNVGSTQLTLHYTVLQGQRIAIASGQDQSAQIESILTNPLVVRVLDDALNPVPNETVVFRVAQDSGLVGAGTADEARAVAVETNAQGIASTRFRLGARSGVANQKVHAKVVGYDDEAVFNASALANPGDRIGVNSGNNQRGAVGQTLPDPFVVVVADDGGNVVHGASVRFDVMTGGGTLTGGGTSYQTQTDSDGRATAEYTLGSLRGIDAQMVTATLLDTGTETVTAGFQATGFIPGDPGQTTISGFVLDNQDNAVPGVTVRVVGTTRQAVADGQGQFKITEAPVGAVHLLAEGSTASGPGEYPSLSYNLVTVAGVDNPLSAPIYMVKLDTTHAQVAGPTAVALELPEYPGFKLEIAKDGVTFPDGSRTGLVSVTAVNSSAVPMVPPNGMQPQFIISIQPTNARFDPPAALTIPNLDSYAPGTQTEMYSFDHDLEEFVPIGLGTVSEDGSVIHSNAGVGVIKAGWHATTKPDDKGCTCTCGSCQTCTDKCGCVAGGGDPGIPDSPGDCQTPVCQNGSAQLVANPVDVPPDVPGDCSSFACQGTSPVPETDDTDLPPSDSECKTCSGGTSDMRVDSVAPSANGQTADLYIPLDPVAAAEVAFSATASATGCTSMDYAWDFGDGGTANIAAPSHTYSATGDYTVAVTAKCSGCEGGEARATLRVVVFAALIRTPTTTSWSIDATPAMPAVQFEADIAPPSAQAQATFKWRLERTFVKQTQSHSSLVPAGGTVDLTGTTTWSPYFGPGLYGATSIHVFLEVTVGSSNAARHDVDGYKITGTNPPEADVRAHLGLNPFFIQRIVQRESGYQHFFPGDNLPNWGPPNGWGLMQTDPPPSEQTLWDWRQNVVDGRAVLAGKQTVANTFWNNQVNQWMAYNTHNPPVPAHANIVVSDITFSHAGGGGTQPFSDALWIKCYNGCNQHWMAWQNSNPAVTPFWQHNGGVYVTNVLSLRP